MWTYHLRTHNTFNTTMSDFWWIRKSSYLCFGSVDGHRAATHNSLVDWDLRWSAIPQEARGPKMFDDFWKSQCFNLFPVFQRCELETSGNSWNFTSHPSCVAFTRSRTLTSRPNIWWYVWVRKDRRRSIKNVAVRNFESHQIHVPAGSLVFSLLIHTLKA